MVAMNIVTAAGRAAGDAGQPGRHGRRRAATRAALIGAAQQLISEGRTDVSIATITERADVGFGSFYNHFKTKEQLFSAAFAEAMDSFSLGLGQLTQGVEDPARAVSIGFRVIGRVTEVAPGFASLIIRSGPAALTFNGALRQTSLRLLSRGIRSRRFCLHSAEMAYAAVGGALLGTVTWLLSEPDADTEEVIDSLAAGALRMLGIPETQAQLIAHEELPECAPDESLVGLTKHLGAGSRPGAGGPGAGVSEE